MGTATLTRDALAAASAAAGAAPACTAAWHGTQRAYRVAGCRCDPAIAAHEAYRARQKVRQQMTRNDRAKRDPDCPGRIHPASLVGWRAGCRCPDTWEAHEAEELRLAAREERAARVRMERADAARSRYRGEAAGVDRLTVHHLLAGYAVRGTAREYWLAERELRRRGMGLEPAAMWLGVTPAAINNYKEQVREGRRDRIKRRLADARWREARNGWLAARDEVRQLGRVHALARAERALAAAERELVAARQAFPADRTRRRLADTRRRAARNHLLRLRRDYF